eukprot:scaffold5.g1014.t1
MPGGAGGKQASLTSSVPQIAEELLQPGAEWDVYRCYNHQLPSLDTLSQYTELAWIRELGAWLRRAVEWHPGVRFLGICFGCQVMAAALGGEVGKNPSGRFVLCVESIGLTERGLRCEAYRRACKQAGLLDPPDVLRIIQSHGDQVLKLPPAARVLASSPTAAYEIWGMGMNGHAELTREAVMEKIHPAIADSGRFTAGEAAASAASIQRDPTDASLVAALFQQFMVLGLREEGAGGDASGADSLPASGIAHSPSEAASPGTSPRAPTVAGTPSATQPDPASRQAVAEAAATLLRHAEVAVCAELERGVLEPHLLQRLNSLATARVSAMVPAVASAKRQIAAVTAQQAELLTALRGVDTLEGQVGALEAAVDDLEAAATRLEALHLPPAASPRPAAT